jgi:hypothetical protein
LQKQICGYVLDLRRSPGCRGDSMKAEQEAAELVKEAAANFEELVI